MLRTAELETIIHDNKLPAGIEETGQTWVRVGLTDPQTGLSNARHGTVGFRRLDPSLEGPWLSCPSMFRDGREPGGRRASVSGGIKSRVQWVIDGVCRLWLQGRTWRNPD